MNSETKVGCLINGVGWRCANTGVVSRNNCKDLCMQGNLTFRGDAACRSRFCLKALDVRC